MLSHGERIQNGAYKQWCFVAQGGGAWQHARQGDESDNGERRIGAAGLSSRLVTWTNEQLQEVVLDLMAEEMLNEISMGAKGFLIDGYPRQVQQAIQFEQEVRVCGKRFA